MAAFSLLLLLAWPLGTPDQAAGQAAPDVGWLGISIADITEDQADRLASTFGPGAGTGVVVVDVLKGGPADGSRLQRGDVIVSVDSQPIWDVRQLQRTIRDKPTNQQVTLTVLRQASRLTVPVTVGPMPLAARAQLAGERFGFVVRGADEGEPPQGQVVPKGRVLVAFVDSDSPAARGGLRVQDVILLVNEQPIRSLEEFDGAMRRGGRTTRLLVGRRGAQTPLPVTLELPAR
jgi:serine protease Do